jgi:tetratricopeptide (TPR) repeat protein
MSADSNRAGADAKANIFISYSRRDSAFVNRLEAGLVARGFRLFVDRNDIYAFEDWWRRIQTLIAETDAIVFVISPDAVKSSVCVKEIAFASSLNKRLAPIVCRSTAIDEVPEAIRALNFIYFNDIQQFDLQLDRLATALVVNLDWIREHTWLGGLAHRWEQSAHPDTMLLRGDELAKAERWLELHSAGCPQPTALHAAFISASRKRNVQRDESIGNAALNSNKLVIALVEKLRNQEGVPHALIASMLRNAQAIVGNLDSDGVGVQSLLRARAVGLVELSSTSLAHGDNAGALEAAEKAALIFEKLTGAEGREPSETKELFVSLDRSGDALFEVGRYEDALGVYERALALARSAIVVDGSDPIWLHHLSVALEKVGDLNKHKELLDEAFKLYGESLTIREQRAARDPASSDAQRDVATALERIAEIARVMQRYEEAVKTYHKSLAIREALARSHPRHTEWLRELAIAHENLGDVFRLMRNQPSALAEYESARTVTDRLVVSDPSNERWRSENYRIHNRAGAALLELGRPSAALEIFLRALDLARAHCDLQGGDQDWRAAAAFFQLCCSTLALSNMVPEALALAKESAQFLEDERNSGPDRLGQVARAWNNAAWYALLQGRADIALSAADRADHIVNNDPTIQVNLLHSLALSGRTEEAKALYARCRDLRVSDSSWADTVRSDLDDLDRHGIDTSKVKSILSM